MRHADIRTTMNVYGKAMDESKREAHGKVVRLVITFEGGLASLSAP
jgi:integrase